MSHPSRPVCGDFPAKATRGVWPNPAFQHCRKCFKPKKPLVGLSDSFPAPLPSDAPQCQHPSQLFTRCPAVLEGASPTPWGRGGSPSPGLSSPSHTQRPGSAAPPPPHTRALVRGSEPRQKATCAPATLTQPSAHVPREVSSRRSQPGWGVPRPSPPPRASVRPHRAEAGAGRRWHRRARAAAVDDVVGDARVLGDAEHIVPGAN